MNVSELRLALANLDPDMPVMTSFGGDGDGYCDINYTQVQEVVLDSRPERCYGGEHETPEDIEEFIRIFSEKTDPDEPNHSQYWLDEVERYRKVLEENKRVRALII